MSKNRIAVIALEQALADLAHEVEHTGPYSNDFRKGMRFGEVLARAAMTDPEATRKILRQFDKNGGKAATQGK